MGTRRKSRELAMQMLYQLELGKQAPEYVRATFWAERKDVEPGVRDFAAALFGLALDHAERIDRLIEAHARNWRLERMASVDRNLLRAAVAEMIGYPETPRPIVINEAIEIARRYSSPESIQFVNGVLDSIAKEL
jgi:N utilization substance protein B